MTDLPPSSVIFFRRLRNTTVITTAKIANAASTAISSAFCDLTSLRSASTASKSGIAAESRMNMGSPVGRIHTSLFRNQM